MNEIGKMMMALGGILFFIGVFVTFIGKLPGDIVIKRENMTVYFPIVTCIVISVILSLISLVIGKFK